MTKHREYPLGYSGRAFPAVAAIFEDLIADFIIEEGREADLLEMAHLARLIRRVEAAL